MPDSQVRDATTSADKFRRVEFQELPLKLSARMASGSSTLAELRELLAQGSLIPLETRLGEPAQLLANGQPIATGELVVLQGRMSFRLTRLGASRD